ncbi:major capsid protein [uncultured Sulfitobacter sp.]|uniref:major capsid protein n=1 Tax=uncultured Sulfitobacter sp. TaxID=191468 RepID=UPI0025994B31|nr:major capsid protein [uncultured Sulfitobacter sp.]
MSYDLYGTTALLGVIRKVPIESSYWLDNFFGSQINFDTEDIMFDKVKSYRRMAPFVSPVVQGRVMKSRGYETVSFRPAYTKPKHIVDPNKMFTRLAGEGLGGTLSPGARWNAAVADNLREEKESIYRLWSWMAAMAIIHGEVTVTGEDYPTQVVNFGRHGDLTETLAGTARWGEADADPLGDVQNLRKLAFQHSGSPITRLTMGLEAFDRFFDDEDVQKLLKDDIRTSKSELSAIGSTDTPYEYRGVLQGYNGQGRLEIFTYNEQYEDADDNTVDMMSTYDVIGTGNGLRGTRCFGAIRDRRAGLQPSPLFPKMWDNEDPSVTYTMSQSAPLMVPGNPDNSFRLVSYTP